MRKLVFVLAFGLAGPAAANSYIPDYPYVTAPLPSGFEVTFTRPGGGPPDYWCAAADHARRTLGASRSQRIYLSQAEGPSSSRSGRKGVGFSLTEPASGAAGSSLSLSIKSVGDSLTIAQAQGYCGDRNASD